MMFSNLIELVFDHYAWLYETRYLVFGIVPAVIVTIALVIEYLIIYKRLVKEQNERKHPAVLWWAVTIYYIFVLIASIAFPARDNPTDTYGIHSATRKCMPLFYSYREACVFGYYAFENIIINIAAFVPLGFLLPVGKRTFRKFRRTVAVGFFFAVCIETGQLLFGKAPFDLDDLLNHTLGPMIGYGGYILFDAIKQKFREERTADRRSRSIRAVLVHQIPLFVIITVLSVIFTVHENRELGDLYSRAIIAFDRNKLTVSSEKVWSDEPGELPVYQLTGFTEAEAAEFARHFYRNIGSDLKYANYNVKGSFEDGVCGRFESEEGYGLQILYPYGTYSFTDYTDTGYDYSTYDPEFPDEDIPFAKTGASEQEIREVLLEYDIQLPEGAVFEESEKGAYSFTVSMISDEDYIYDGYLYCSYYTDGKMRSIHNNIQKYMLYKTFPVISESVAYEQICNGKFIWRANLSGGLPRQIKVEDCSIIYELDSKHFFQPVYHFDCRIYGGGNEITIPCIQ